MLGFAESLMEVGPIPVPVEELGAEEHERLVSGARTRGPGEKSFTREDGRTVKLFCRKGHSRKARQFALNSRRLARLGFESVEIQGVYHCPGKGQTVVIYPTLPGSTLRQRLTDGADANRLLPRLARFVATLHAKGVYFRRLHMGNIIVMPDGRFGLLDIADLQLYPRKLRLWSRIRNFKPFFRYEVDSSHLRQFGVKKFLDIYLQAAGLGACRSTVLVWMVKRLASRGAQISSPPFRHPTARKMANVGLLSPPQVIRRDRQRAQAKGREGV